MPFVHGVAEVGGLAVQVLGRPFVVVHHRAVPVEDGDPEAGLFEQPIRPLAQRPVRDDPVIGDLGAIGVRCHSIPSGLLSCLPAGIRH